MGSLNKQEIIQVADSTRNADWVDVLGNKSDAAQQAVAATRSLVGYTKALKTNDGDPSGHALTTWTAKWGNLAQSFAAWAGDMSGHVLTSVTAKWGNIARSLDLILGSRWDAAGDLGTDIAALIAGVGSTPVLTKGTTGISNFNAAPVAVISLTPAGPTELSGVSLSHNGFTATATITYRVYKMTNGVEDLFLTFTRIVGTDPDGVIILDSPDVIDGTGALNSWRVTVQSNNAGDAARTMRFQYTTKRII